MRRARSGPSPIVMAHASRRSRHPTCMPRLELFRFRYRDRVTGKWVKAPTSLNDTRSLHGTASGRSPGPGRSGTSIRAHAISRHGRSCRTPSLRRCRNCRRRCSRTLLSRRRGGSVPDIAISSQIRHILRAAKAICTNARGRTITSQRSGYCRLERLTSASSEAAVSTNSCRSGRFGTPPRPTCLEVLPLAATARNSCAARSI